MDSIEFSETYHLYFGTKAEEIDPITLATSLLSLTTVVDELNRELHTNKKIELKVKPFKPGSFDVPVEFVQLSLAAVLSSSNLSYINQIIEYFVNLLNLRKHLKSQRPQKVNQIGDKVEVTNHDGNVLIANNITLNIYEKNTSLGEALDRQFQILEQDKSISDFRITDDKKNPVTEVTREDFKYLKEYHEEPKVEISKKGTIPEQAKLNIFKVVFDEKSKWDFFYRGIKISAKIQDEVFNRRVIDGEKFANGDLLEVELEIDQEYDETANTFANKAYRILKVLGHIPRSEQIKLSYEKP
ncbi:MAG: hypothetical protein HY753_09180 [Nitrospirae bacterium]|nr:hypothetical protein [Nitrospirota bacterium]